MRTAILPFSPYSPASLANSSGIFLGPDYHFDLIRLGYAVYGGNPTPGRPNPMRPVVRLETSIVQVREIGPGETVGYNGRWTAPATRTASAAPSRTAGSVETAAAAILSPSPPSTSASDRPGSRGVRSGRWQ